MVKDKLDIIYEDKELIVVNKPAHMLTIATEDEKVNTLYHKVYEYLKRKNKSNKVFIVHRLDRDTSGIVLFAKNQKLKELLQNDWNNCAITREYIAVVEGYVDPVKQTIKEYLKETKTLLTYATDDSSGKEAITEYEVIKRSKAFSTLKINIKTGRKNQIRVAMQNINHPIIGDKKYGSTKNPLRRICLHALKLEIIHPISKKVYTFETRHPREFAIFEQ
ncbi:MAG: RNA pseudouridine synthase [Bacilli bacterium]|nr:RNA pseudouridine synthase [Bacilli bacterium]